MAELFMVRHGQASFGTDDYDRLSALGERQGEWLGEYFAERGFVFDRVLAGSMRRQRSTAAAILRGLGASTGCEELDGLHLVRELQQSPASRSPGAPGFDQLRVVR